MISASSLPTNVAYLPLNGALYKVQDCIVEEMRHEYHEEFHQTFHGRSLSFNAGPIEARVVLRCFGKMEEVDELVSIDKLKVSSLDTYTNLELLEELEKRTKPEDLMSS